MIDRLTIEEWLAYDAQNPAPTLFARPAWALSLARAYPHMQPAPLRVHVHGERPAIVPLMQMNGGALRWRDWRAAARVTIGLRSTNSFENGNRTMLYPSNFTWSRIAV